MAERLTAARPYAEAAFELASSRGELAPWSAALRAAAAVMRDPAMARLALSPKLSRAQLAEAVIDISGRLAPIGAEAANLIRLLIENRRLTLLPEIAKLFEELRGEAEGIVDAEVTSAVPLSEAQQKKLAESLKQRFKREVRVNARVDADIVGGLIIRAGDLVIDGSVRGSLERLATELVK